MSSQTVTCVQRVLVGCVLFILLPAFPVGGEPVLNFSDLTSGPRSGNSDSSQGQPPDQDGAIVSVWGTGLGTRQGTSKVTVNNAPASHVYFWGDAKPPYSPADLSVRHSMQVVIFQVSHLAADGAGSISITMDGAVSNPLPFVVRPAAIRFVSPQGDNEGGDGGWSKPWRSISRAIDQMKAGDITYVLDGFTQARETDYNAAVNLSLNGTPDKPAALIAYPGATVSIGGDSAKRALGHFRSGYGYTHDWTLAKFNLCANENAVDMGSGFRAVGNHVTAPTANAPEGAIAAQGNNLAVLGNEITEVGKPGASKLTHPIYISSARSSSGNRLPAESNREIAWNYLHDNNANRAINIYSEGASTAYMSGHKVHDNFIVNQVGGGMLLGQYMTGENWVYNNVIANAGLGPEPAGGDAQGHIGVEIEPGIEGGPATTLYFCNNTIYACGWQGAAWGAQGFGHVSFGRIGLYSLLFANNIICSTGTPYLAKRDGAPSPNGGHNLWFGAGQPPTWDKDALNADPRFAGVARLDFHLLPNSPAIGAGIDIRPTIFRDFENVPRPADRAFDLGAYQFPAVSPAASRPSRGAGR